MPGWKANWLMRSTFFTSLQVRHGFIIYKNGVRGNQFPRLAHNWFVQGLSFQFNFTHWNLDKMATISTDDISYVSSRMRNFVFRFEFSCFRSLLLRVQVTISQHWFKKWLGTEQVSSHYLNQWWTNLPTHICVTRPQWVDPCIAGLSGLIQMVRRQIKACNLRWKTMLNY